MSELLSKDEMAELTGAATKAKQIQVLRDANIAFVTRVDGWPRTTWFNVNNPAHLRAVKLEEEPNFEAIG